MTGSRAILVSNACAVFDGAIPLGAMAVATALRRGHGVDCDIVDLPAEDPGRIEAQIAQFWEGIEVRRFLFAGFSTMCNTLPRSLSLARCLKNLCPELPVVFGGPEASISARRLLDAYPFIDGVVVGEAEAVLGDLVAALLSGDRSSKPGLLFRGGASHGAAPQVAAGDLETVDYETYPRALQQERLAVEAGRGCPYSCTFCSTSDFFGRRFRLKSPERLVDDVTRLVRDRGVTRFDFVHDLFTTDRRRVVEICEAFLRANLRVGWTCSARTDRVDEELLRLMQRAGCDGVFVGLETGSQRLQKLIRKNLPVREGVEMLRVAAGILPTTVALIIGFPFETEEDLAETFDVARELREAGLSVQLHLLAPAAGTRLSREFAGRLAYDGYLAVHTSVNCLTEWEELEIRRRPEIFCSFYYFRNPEISRSMYKWLHQAFHSGSEAMIGAAGRDLVQWARAAGSYPATFLARWSEQRRSAIV